jgi:hypothetical protein
MSDFAVARRGNGNRVGNRIPNRYTVINQANNQIYNSLVNGAGLNISLGANVCFYTNKLNNNQFTSLLDSIFDPATKKEVSDSQRNKRAINWISTTAFTDQGKNPCDSMREAIFKYNNFNLDYEGKRISSYGIAELRLDFSRLPIIKEGGCSVYPYGCFFFSDLSNGYDNYVASISCVQERINDVMNYKYIKPVPFDSQDGIISCAGKFRTQGNFIIFYVANEIEKQEDQFYPDITIINITVGCAREQKSPYIVKESFVCNIRKGSNCVGNIIDYITRDIFSFYGVNDLQFCGEIIHAFGFDPLEYSFPPSLGDERSRHYIYENNPSPMNTAGHNYRHTKPFTVKTNLFSYLDSINKKNEVNIVLHQNDENKSDYHDKDEESKKFKNFKNKKNKDFKNKKDVEETETILSGDDRSPEYSDKEFDAALDAVEYSEHDIPQTDDNGIDTDDIDEVVDGGVIIKENDESDEEQSSDIENEVFSEEIQSSEESPQMGSIDIDETVDQERL